MSLNLDTSSNITDYGNIDYLAEVDKPEYSINFLNDDSEIKINYF